MVQSVGAYEAKTRLPELLRAVGHGKSFLITHRNQAIARLVPIEKKEVSAVQAVEALRSFVAARNATWSANELDDLRRSDRR